MAEVEPVVLLAEDNEDNQMIYAAALEHAGFRVVVAVDGYEAVRRTRELLPSIVLMDLSMPRIDGWEAALVLKADRVTREIPIIALTAHVMTSEQARIQRLGFAAYLAKPIPPRVVVEEVRRVLAGKPGSFFAPSRPEIPDGS